MYIYGIGKKSYYISVFIYIIALIISIYYFLGIELQNIVPLSGV